MASSAVEIRQIWFGLEIGQSEFRKEERYHFTFNYMKPAPLMKVISSILEHVTLTFDPLTVE